MKVLYVGYTLGVYQSAPVRPVASNLKDPAKIAAAKQEHIDEALSLAPKIPTCGYVSRLAVRDADDTPIFDVDLCQPDSAEAACAFIDAITNFYNVEGINNTQGDRDDPFYLVGFGVHTLVRVACLEVLRQNLTAHARDRRSVPMSLVRGEQMLVDPYLAMLHTEDRKYVSLPHLLRYLDIPFDEATMLHPAEQARLAHALTVAGQLLSF